MNTLITAALFLVVVIMAATWAVIEFGPLQTVLGIAGLGLAVRTLAEVVK